jgi:putative DNA primase/helicase
VTVTIVMNISIPEEVLAPDDSTSATSTTNVSTEGIRVRIADAARLQAEGMALEAELALAAIANETKLSRTAIKAEFKAALHREKAELNALSNTEALQVGRAIIFDSPDPAPNRTSLASVIDTVAGVFRTRVECDAATTDAVALWTVASWGCRPPGHDGGSDLFPRLLFTSATKRCGKSTALETVRALVARPLGADGLSEAALFRTTAQHFPTLLLDEGDAWLRDNEAMRGLLNSGFSRSGQVIRVVEEADGNGGRALVPRAFSTFCPVVLAGIGNMPATVEDRSIRGRLERKPTGRKAQRVRQRDLMKVRAKIGPHLAAWADDLARALSEGVSPQAIPAVLGDRDADNWEPLFAVAALAGESWPQRADAAALKLCADGDVRRDRTEMLLADIREFARQERQQRWDSYRAWRMRERKAGQLRPSRYDFMRTGDLLSWLISRDTSPWAESNRGRPLSPHGLSRMLKAVKVTPDRDKRGGRVMRDEGRGFWVRDLRAAWRRYL